MTDTLQSAHAESESQSIYRHFWRELQPVDVLLLLVAPTVLGLVSVLPAEIQQEMAFEIGNPSAVDAFTSHFVHASDWHLFGNLALYVLVAPVAYLLCILSDRKELFRYTVVVFLLVFPLALSAMQLSFLTERTTLGFSGINAAFVGLLCFALVSYVGRVLTSGSTDRHAPALLFSVFGLVTLVGLPERAWRTELALLSFGVAALYVVTALYTNGVPTRAAIKNAVNKPGYVELAGAGLGVALMYPFVGFGGELLADGDVTDVYIHLLGLALGFIVVYVFVVITEEL